MITTDKFKTIIAEIKQEIKKIAEGRNTFKQSIKQIRPIICKYNEANWIYPTPSNIDELKDLYLQAYEEHRERIKDLKVLNKEDITVMHILYNRLRNKKSHTGSVEKDNKYLATYNKTKSSKVDKILKKYNVKYVGEKEYVEMFEVDDE